ncbi:uncharacterized protein LOC143424449 [Xylocopa sonorina]|uniref:uncharacterized protein LOC143424449 n=1 Tax=Xylocopa sonorina TaxID=1818115 RepID=UPI00403AD7CB
MDPTLLRLFFLLKATRNRLCPRGEPWPTDKMKFISYNSSMGQRPAAGTGRAFAANVLVKDCSRVSPTYLGTVRGENRRQSANSSAAVHRKKSNNGADKNGRSRSSAAVTCSRAIRLTIYAVRWTKTYILKTN